MIDKEPQAFNAPSRLRRATALFVTAAILSACTPGETAPEMPPEQVEVTLPEIIPEQSIGESPLPQTLQPENEVACAQNTTPIFQKGPYLFMDPDGTDLPFETQDAIVDLINATHPDVSLEKFAQEYLNAAQLIMQDAMSFDIKFVVDPTIDLSYWNEEESADAKQSVQNNDQKITLQRELANSLSNIIEEAGRYPSGLYDELGIERIRLASVYEHFAGHYDTANDEILFELDSISFPKSWVNELMTHELAHAYHDRFCGGIIGNDPQLSRYNSIAYVGYQNDHDDQHSDGATPYDTIPAKLTAYGPEREFFNTYGASSAAEDFATTVEYTLVQRGLIQEGDADYNSPLYHKQRLIVERLENMMPGARNFLEIHTTLLRLRESNEIHETLEDRPIVQFKFSDLQAIVANTEEGQLVLNAIYSSDYAFERSEPPYPSLVEKPVIELDSHQESSYLSLTSNLFGKGATVRRYIGGPNETLLTIFVPASDVTMGTYTGKLFSLMNEQNQDETELLAEQIDMTRLLTDSVLQERLKSKDYVPITLSILPEPIA